MTRATRFSFPWVQMPSEPFTMRVRPSRVAAMTALLAGRRLLGACFALALLPLLAGCEKKTQKAGVTFKDYVPAAKPGEPLTD